MSESATGRLREEIRRSHSASLEDLTVAVAAVTAASCGLEPAATRPPVRVDIEHNGRRGAAPDADWSSVIGWLTAIYPLGIRVDDRRPGDVLAGVVATRGDVPGNGLHYGTLRYSQELEPEYGQAVAAPDGAVIVNYGGELGWGRDTDARAWPALVTGGIPPTTKRTHQFEISAFTRKGCFEVRIKHRPERRYTDAVTAGYPGSCNGTRPTWRR